MKTPVVILIVIWETETNPHSDVHKLHHVAYAPPAMRWCVSPLVASTRLCLSAKSLLVSNSPPLVGSQESHQEKRYKGIFMDGDSYSNDLPPAPHPFLFYVIHHQPSFMVEVKFGERDQKGDFTLRHGDWVQFNIATDRRDHLQKATNISLLDDSFNVSGEKREHGVIAALKDGYGFIKCADRDARLFFHYSELLDPENEISVNDEVMFTVAQDTTNQSPNRQSAIRIHRVNSGTVKFEVLVTEGVQGHVAIEAPASPRTPTKASGRSSPSEKIEEPGVISYIQDGVKQTINYYAKNCDRPVQVGDKVEFNIYKVKRTKELIAMGVKVVRLNTTIRQSTNNLTSAPGMVPSRAVLSTSPSFPA
ncbi:Cold shock domain-containing protein E1 [Portunus trituberculatus]|uniref:Cold shock domain-containing protein E1 n=1 Tax=Portunus trituberculatus TaxID=210409 RepID=A0A5B7FCE6_PORTR|nr:Cold shock domain-containing protein E1 [Portunus trituberculatus]